MGMVPTDRGLLFSNLAAAQNRSFTMGRNMGCDGILTQYWYESIQLTNGQGCMIVRQDPPYNEKPGPTALSQLTPNEISALQPYATIQPLLPPPPK